MEPYIMAGTSELAAAPSGLCGVAPVATGVVVELKGAFGKVPATGAPVPGVVIAWFDRAVTADLAAFWLRGFGTLKPWACGFEALDE
jgi:hypothetical protein